VTYKSLNYNVFVSLYLSSQIKPDSIAKRAGLLLNDNIIKINGEDVWRCSIANGVHYHQLNHVLMIRCWHLHRRAGPANASPSTHGSTHGATHGTTIVGRRSELRGGPHPFSQKSGTPPTLSKIILPSRKSTKIGKKIDKIAKNCLK
jgi:hypothetical protein